MILGTWAGQEFWNVTLGELGNAVLDHNLSFWNLSSGAELAFKRHEIAKTFMILALIRSKISVEEKY